MRYLAVAEVLRIHERAIVQYGGSLGVLNRGLLESALATPQQTMFGKNLYPDLISQAAILFFLLIKNHPFLDGNKRTAFLCLIRFLEVNGFEIQADDDQLYQFTADVASSTIDKEHVTEWIRTRTK